jgi:uncharacterized protein (DUF433 family)
MALSDNAVRSMLVIWEDEPRSNLWAEPEVRPSAGQILDQNDWASQLKPISNRALEWYFQCNLIGYETLRRVADINPRRRGGVPVLKGTRFTVSQALAELADSSGVSEVAQNFDVDANTIKEMLEGLSLVLMQPLRK